MGLKKIEFENQLAALPDYFYSGLYSLECVDFPQVTEAGDSGVSYLYGLRSVHMPKLKKVGNNFMSACHGDFLLEPLEFPELEEVGNDAFRDCYSLTELYLPKLKKTGKNFCYNTPNLSKLILPADFDLGQFTERNNGGINVSVLI